MAPALDGPRLPPASGREPKQLVVFLHGFGADGNDLIALGREWAPLLPDAAFVSPHAPERCAMSPSGRQWFELTFRDPGEYWRGVSRASPAIDAFLDAELNRHSLPASALALVGFSQGTMMALHTGLRRAAAPAAIVGYSGMLAGADHLAGELKSKPPVLLVHGDADEVIPVQALTLARESLASAGIPVEWHVSRRIGHGIDGEGLRLGGAFLKQAFRKPA